VLSCLIKNVEVIKGPSVLDRDIEDVIERWEPSDPWIPKQITSIIQPLLEMLVPTYTGLQEANETVSWLWLAFEYEPLASLSSKPHMITYLSLKRFTWQPKQ
jgi:hypothetical protein